MKYWITMVILIATGMVLFAGERSRQAELEAALDAAMTQTDMNIASAELATYLEEKLEELENQIRATLFGEALDLFDRAAVHWREYRDAHADLVEKRYEGGSIRPLARNTVRARLAEERIELLKGLDPEGRFGECAD